MSTDPAAVEALAAALLGPCAQMDDYTDEGQEILRRRARRLLDSDWLAARDAAMRAEGAAAVLRDLADGLAERSRGAALRAALDRTEGDA